MHCSFLFFKVSYLFFSHVYVEYKSECICVDGAGGPGKEGPALRLASKALLRNSARCYLYSDGTTPETPVSDSSVQVNNKWTYSCYTLAWFTSHTHTDLLCSTVWPRLCHVPLPWSGINSCRLLQALDRPTTNQIEIKYCM